MTVPPLAVEIEPDAHGVHLELLVLRGDPAVFIDSVVNRWVERAVQSARETPLDPDVVRAVRQMLKHGRYRATGRGKPAHEFLFKAAGEDRFPRVFAAVDLLNAVSLRSQLPMSLIDLDAAETSTFRLRRGREGEAFTFNTAGQQIDLQDLLLVATAPGDEPCANPVKDALRTKLKPTSTRFAAMIYAPVELAARAEAARTTLAEAYAEAWPGAHRSSGVASAAS